MSFASPNKRPLLLAMAVAILLLNSIWSVVHSFHVVVTDLRKYDLIQSESLITFAQKAKFSLDADRLEELEDELNAAIGYDAIYAYAIGKDGHFFLRSPQNEVLDQLIVKKKNMIHQAGSLAYIEVDGGPYTIRLAVQKSTTSTYSRFFKEHAGAIARDLIVVLLMAAFILSYFMRDIAQILMALRLGGRTKLDNVKIRSAEGETLLKSITTMNSGMDSLEQQNRMLRNQVLSALSSELQSGRKPPYEFECTLVRVDVNNFSHIFSNYPVEEFMGVINTFFEQVTEIVSRYRGYVYEFVGDEVIFYFKDEEHANSAAIALSALRDINQYAVELDEVVLNQHGYHFRVKSSLAHGRLRFGPQVTGFTLAGAILIETVRILAQISEKETNVIFFDEEIARRVADICESRAQKVVLLKGLTRSHSLYSYVSHLDFEPILESSKSEDTELLGYFRSDAHLVRILQFMHERALDIDIKRFLSLSRKLRSFKIPRPTAALKTAYLDLLQRLSMDCESSQVSDGDLFRLSSALTIGSHILDAESFESEFKTFFKSCLTFSDRRVVANSLDVFSHFASLDEDIIFHKLLRHRDNRVVANALVKEGLKGLSRTVVKQTAKMISSKEPLFVASGLYVVGELARHHRARNPVHYETNVGFQTLVHNVRNFVGHTNQMVRRQTLIAARKTQDPSTREAIETYYLEIADSDGKLEIERLFLKPEPEAEKKEEVQMNQTKVA